MRDAKAGGSKHLDQIAPGLLALRLETFGHGAVESLRHLAADEQQAAILRQFKSHAVAAGRRMDCCGIVADEVSWGHEVSPDCGSDRIRRHHRSAKHHCCGSAQENLLQGHSPSVSKWSPMTYALPPLNALRAFEAAARHLSFKLAAHELHVTPAAVGQQVKALEARLGVQLFERLHKQLILTVAGQAYLTGVSEGFRHIAEATSQLKPAGAVLLQLGIHGSFDLRRLDLAAFRSTHAEIGLRVLHPAGLHELIEGKVDLLLARGLGHHPGYRCDRIDEGSGLGDWLVAPEGTADCPEIVSFRAWLRGLSAENSIANRRPRLVGGRR